MKSKFARWHVVFPVAGAIALAGCGQGAAPAVPQATVGPTQIAKAASPAIPTIAAQASPAVASPVASKLDPLQITGVSTQPNPMVMLRNTGTQPVDLSGWKLRVGNTSATLPQAARISPNETVNVHLAAGTTTQRDIYLGSEGLALVGALRPGTQVILQNAQGQDVTQFSVVTGPGASPSPGLANLQITDLSLNPNDPSFTLTNTGSTPVDMTGWKMRVGNTTVDFPGSAQVAPNEKVTVHLSTGATTQQDIYIGREAAAVVSLLTPGADLAIQNQQGQTVARLAVPGR